jgi:UDP:flavonoid glycosyltransferase YjiC (YdhE family)
VLAPAQLEQFLLANAIEKLGLARVVHPDAQAADIGGALAAGLREPAIARAAREFALRHREPAVDTIADRAAGRIEALARGITE